MYKYAQIQDGTVHWIMEHEADIDTLYAEYFSRDILFVDITNRPEVQEGWRYENGNFIEPPAPPEPTPEEIQKKRTAAVQNHMDTKVQERGYDNILSACTYTNSTDPVFQTEALACVAWRDAVWRTCYDILNEVAAGQREIPTAEELIVELPELIWPEA